MMLSINKCREHTLRSKPLDYQCQNLEKIFPVLIVVLKLCKHILEKDENSFQQIFKVDYFFKF